MSFRQGYWKEVTIACQEKWLRASVDDSSRLVIHHRDFDFPTTRNTIIVLEIGFTQYGIPQEILIDRGTQFISAWKRKVALQP